MFPIDFGVSRMKVKVTVTVTKQHVGGGGEHVLFYKHTLIMPLSKKRGYIALHLSVHQSVRLIQSCPINN